MYIKDGIKGERYFEWVDITAKDNRALGYYREE